MTVGRAGRNHRPTRPDPRGPSRTLLSRYEPNQVSARFIRSALSEADPYASNGKARKTTLYDPSATDSASVCAVSSVNAAVAGVIGVIWSSNAALSTV